MIECRECLLLELPDEVLICIFNFLGYDDLRQTIHVCRRFNGLSEPFLYHSVQALHSAQALALAYSLRGNIQRAGWIRDFLVSTKFGEENGLNALPPFIAEMRNLQNLRLETPDCNTKDVDDRIAWLKLQDRYERIFQMSSALVPNRDLRLLPNLQSCRIHFVDAEKELHLMTQYSSTLFLHTTLKSLTISCASTDFADRLLVPFQKDQTLLKSTPLEHLHLEECDIHSPSLAILLSFPRELKSLKISEGVRYDTMNSRASRVHGNVSPASFVHAIEQNCVESLESLSLSLGYRRNGGQLINQFGQHLNLKAFEMMKFLEIDRGTLSLFRTRPCDHQTWRRLPPNIETLRVFSIPLTNRSPFRPIAPPRVPFEECFFRSKGKHGVSKLSNLILSYDYSEHEAQTILRTTDEYGRVHEINQVELCQPFLLRECSALEPLCKKVGIRLQLDMTVLPSGYIPPYLFTESVPTTSTLWQSEVA